MMTIAELRDTAARLQGEYPDHLIIIAEDQPERASYLLTGKAAMIAAPLLGQSAIEELLRVGAAELPLLISALTGVGYDVVVADLVRGQHQVVQVVAAQARINYPRVNAEVCP